MTASAPEPTVARDPRRAALVAALERPRYEVLAVPGAADDVEQHVPRSLPVTVTATVARGLEPTVQLVEALAARGFAPVPHLAARLVVDDEQLAEIGARLHEAGVRDMFVIAGDGPEPVGAFADAHALLVSRDRLRASGRWPGAERVGVAGYPQGHPSVADGPLLEALLAKQPLADYVVTQLSFDPQAVSDWVGRIRAAGLRLPVHLGVAGVVDRRRLLRIGWRIGVGPSLRYLRRHGSLWARLAAPATYRPDHLLDRLTGELATPGRSVTGLHVCTFGGVAPTERWRRELLDRLGRG